MMCERPPFERRTLPVPVILKRFMAPRLVFILGMGVSSGGPGPLRARTYDGWAEARQGSGSRAGVSASLIGRAEAVALDPELGSDGWRGLGPGDGHPVGRHIRDGRPVRTAEIRQRR